MDRIRSQSWLLALGALTCLVAMVTVTLITGASQEAFEITRPPAEYGAALLADAGALRVLFGLDAVFLVLYAALFVTFAMVIRNERNGALVGLGAALVVATAVLDMIEDHHILAMLAAAEQGELPGAGQIAFEHVLSQVKFHLSYLGLFLLGLALPRDRRIGRALANLLTVGTLSLGAVIYAAPASWLPALDLTRWIGFVIGFVMTIGFLRASAPAAGSGARG